MLERLRQWGPTVLLTDGDVVFQPRKVERSGHWEAVNSHVLIYLHKELALEDDEVEIVPNFAFDFERLEPCPPCLHREIRPPSPRSVASACAVTRGNIAELAATALVALLIVLLSVRTIGYRGERSSGREGFSQSSLKDQAFSAFLDQPLSYFRKMGFCLRQKPLPSNGPSSTTVSSSH